MVRRNTSVRHLGLDDTSAALDWLAQAVEERHLGFFMPSADALYDGVRSNPRFIQLMQRANLPSGSALHDSQRSAR